MEERPVALTVICWTSIVCGLLCCMCSVGILGMLVGGSAGGMGPSEMTAGMDDPLLQGAGVIQNGIALLLSLVLVVMAAFALDLRPWARRGMVTWAWVFIAWTVGATAVQMVYILPRQEEALRESGVVMPDIPGFMAMAMGCGVLFNLILPVAILVVMNRPSVREAFEIGWWEPPDLDVAPPGDDAPPSDPDAMPQPPADYS